MYALWKTQFPSNFAKDDITGLYPERAEQIKQIKGW